MLIQHVLMKTQFGVITVFFWQTHILMIFKPNQKIQKLTQLLRSYTHVDSGRAPSFRNEALYSDFPNHLEGSVQFLLGNLTMFKHGKSM